MNYDCVIIGGGIAGLLCGIKCAGRGLRCLIVSSGMSALHFSSGSIDLLGYHPAGELVRAPFDALASFINSCPDHPYAKCGEALIEDALFFLKKEVARENFYLYSNERDNHFHVTTLGTLKPAFFSQSSVFNEHLKESFEKKPKIAILTFEGFRDFYPELVSVNLKNQALFQACEIITGSIDVSAFHETKDSHYEFRSIDIGRLFDSEKYLNEIANQINAIAGEADIVGLPAFIGISRYNTIFKKLQALTRPVIYEIPTLPPSILGMRLDNALKRRFAELGGLFVAGDKVIGGEIRAGLLESIHTRNQGDSKIKAPFFVLATGSFFSGGIISRFDVMQEPVLALSVEYPQNRCMWHSKDFFHPDSHPFLQFGVKTNETLNPWDDSGKAVRNLFCAGAVLSGYNPIKEASGSGVAISTGYYAAKQIIARCRKA